MQASTVAKYSPLFCFLSFYKNMLSVILCDIINTESAMLLLKYGKKKPKVSEFEGSEAAIGGAVLVELLL